MGLPILNPALAVQAVGFQHWFSACAGILVTPWMMNLLVLPSDGASWDGEPGTKRRFELPAGPGDFILCDEKGIGPYLSQSLFSPMSSFASQEQAVDTASRIMAGLMRPGERESAPDEKAHSPSRRELLRGLFGREPGS